METKLRTGNNGNPTDGVNTKVDPGTNRKRMKGIGTAEIKCKAHGIKLRRRDVVTDRN